MHAHACVNLQNARTHKKHTLTYAYMHLCTHACICTHIHLHIPPHDLNIELGATAFETLLMVTESTRFMQASIFNKDLVYDPYDKMLISKTQYNPTHKSLLKLSLRILIVLELKDKIFSLFIVVLEPMI